MGNGLADLFRSTAEKAGCRVGRAGSLEEAFGQVLDLCLSKKACEILVSGCDLPLSGAAEELCLTKVERIIAAPGLGGKDLDTLARLCRESGVALITQGLRGHLGGIDIGLTWADAAIAETGSLVLDSTSEELRLATMISEIHVVLLSLDRIYPSLADYPVPAGGRSPSYFAHISGPSRTADIERVLTIGVHGPLELHVLLFDNRQDKEGRP
jgi:L-lactate dehydrogenase complex protein LldG